MSVSSPTPAQIDEREMVFPLADSSSRVIALRC
jgi:hypothetical protein